MRPWNYKWGKHNMASEWGLKTAGIKLKSRLLLGMKRQPLIWCHLSRFFFSIAAWHLKPLHLILDFSSSPAASSSDRSTEPSNHRLSATWLHCQECQSASSKWDNPIFTPLSNWKFIIGAFLNFVALSFKWKKKNMISLAVLKSTIHPYHISQRPQCELSHNNKE